MNEAEKEKRRQRRWFLSCRAIPVNFEFCRGRHAIDGDWAKRDASLSYSSSSPTCVVVSR
ncbi:hypothetical protein U1Q18_027736, partial [Sarracenia purpurea var. burkii]